MPQHWNKAGPFPWVISGDVSHHVVPQCVTEENNSEIRLSVLEFVVESDLDIMTFLGDFPTSAFSLAVVLEDPPRMHNLEMLGNMQSADFCRQPAQSPGIGQRLCV